MRKSCISSSKVSERIGSLSQSRQYIPPDLESSAVDQLCFDPLSRYGGVPKEHFPLESDQCLEKHVLPLGAGSGQHPIKSHVKHACSLVRVASQLPHLGAATYLVSHPTENACHWVAIPDNRRTLRRLGPWVPSVAPHLTTSPNLFTISANQLTLWTNRSQKLTRRSELTSIL
jgi:hypothetical protein